MPLLTRLGGKNEKRVSRAIPTSSFNVVPSSSWQSTHAAKVRKDVIIRTLPFCTRRDIIALASLSRSFNKAVTFHVLSRCGFHLDEGTSKQTIKSPNRWTYPPWKHLAPHLIAIAIWIQSVDTIYYGIGFPIEEGSRALRHISNLLARLPSSSVDFVQIELHPMDSDNCADIEPGFVNADNWDAAVRCLLETVGRKGVKRKLSITNGRCLPLLLLPPGYKIIQGALQPITHKAPPPICSDQIAVAVPSPSPQTSPPEQSLTPPTRLEVSLPGPDATATRDHANSLPTLFKGLFATFSGRKRRKRPSVAAMPTLLPPDVQAQHTTILQASQEPTEPVVASPPPEPLPTSSAISDATDATPFHSTSTSDHSLKTLHLDSPYFFYTPQHLNHTLDFIKSQSTTLTSLSIGEQTLTTTAWKDILHAVNIPTLTRLKISSSLFANAKGASIEDLDNFFRRHEGITHVELYGMHPPPSPPVYDPSVVVKSPLLPNVIDISAHPWYIAMVVDQHTSASAGGSFRSSLRSVAVLMESYGYIPVSMPYRDPYVSHFQTPPEEITVALEALGRLSTQSFSLTIPYARYHDPNTGSYTRWIEAMIEQGRQSICARLQNIQTISIVPSTCPSLTHTLLTKTYPAFFNLFPKLEGVRFHFATGREFSYSELQQIWQRECPSIKQIMVSGLWRVAPAPRVSVEQDTFISDQIVEA